MAVSVQCLPERPAEVAQFLATAAGRSFATGDAFERALAAQGDYGPLRIFVARNEGRIVAALPGRLEQRFGGAWFRAQPHGTPAGPGFDAELGEGALAEVAAALWQGVGETVRRHGWLGGDVTLYGPAAAPGATSLRPPPVMAEVRFDDAHVIDLSAGPAAWRASLDKRSRAMLRKPGERGVTLAPGNAQEDLDQVYTHFLGQARAWGLRQVRPLSFYRALLEPPTDARLWVGRLEGRVVCGVLGFVSAEETYAWWSGSSPEARPAQAFPGTLAFMIETCGSRRVNFGFSGGQSRLTDFKEQLGAAPLPTPILELAPRPRTPWHALLVHGRAAMRARIRKAKARGNSA